MKKTFQFLLKYSIAGLIAACVIHTFWPRLTQPPPTTLSTTAGPFTYAKAVQSAAPAVVNIHSEKIVERQTNHVFADPMFDRFFGELAPKTRKQEKQTSLGSGVIISPKGYLLTNLHVIQGATEINVSLTDGRTTQATIVGVDPGTDLAVLKITLTQLPVIQLPSTRTLQVGDVALAIGNPFNVGQTVTMGIISATGRNHLGINTFENFIQTDAAINPGNSGGALINPLGQLIGINTAIFSKSGGSQGIGFAIPIDLAYDVFNQIIQHGRAVRGWLGVRAMTLTPEIARNLNVPELKGALVETVFKNGPAEHAGLLPHDIVTHINGEPIESTYDIMIKVANTKPGTHIRITGVRNKRPFSVTAKTTERPPIN